MIDYGRFSDRLRARTSRWELLREFQEEWGYRVPEGATPWPRWAEDEHEAYVRRLKAEHTGEEDDRFARVDLSLPVPAALDEWWDLPFNSFTYSARLYETNPEWPPTLRPDPSGDGPAEGVPLAGPDGDHRVCVFMAENQYCNEWGYLAAEAGSEDPRVLVSTEGGWRVQSRSISEFFLQLAVHRLPASLGWSAQLGADDFDGPFEERLAELPEMGLPPWWEFEADAVAHGAPDAIVWHNRSGYVDWPVEVQARSRDAMDAVLARLGARPGRRVAPPEGEVVRVLVETLVGADGPERARAAERLARLARERPEAVRAEAPKLVPLLADPDPAVRRVVPYLLAVGGPELVPPLRERFAAESDPGAAASLVLAVGRLGAAAEAPPYGWLGEVLAGSPVGEVRAAAVVALIECDVEEVSGFHFNLLNEQVKAEESALDGLPWAHEGRAELLTAGWNESLAAHVYMAGVMMRISDDAVEYVQAAGELMRGWRHVRPRLLPPMAEQLAAPDAELRVAAVRELATMGPFLAPVAELLAPLLDDPDPRLAGGALDALARAGDARAVPALSRDLPYDVEHAVAGLADHAGAVVPLLRSRLGEDVLAGLRAWGPRAAPLVPELAGLVETVPEAAAVLGAIGPAAAPALPALRAGMAPGRPRLVRAESAWAYWAISGEAGEALEILEAAIRHSLPEEAARRLLDLGEAARPALPLLPAEPPAACVAYRLTGEPLPEVLDALHGSPALAVRALAERPPSGPVPEAARARLKEIAYGRKVVAEAAAPDIVAADLHLRERARRVLDHLDAPS
ncbi:HEAT repeat domain-containing protein [Actinomadura sp. 21ATH]|uniref:HEAT repeat domain-containing protein n=1 Tax=Actinomadura sp. 21ATH TaxID=1735444 RepID=UPI0035C00556